MISKAEKVLPLQVLRFRRSRSLQSLCLVMETVRMEIAGVLVVLFLSLLIGFEMNTMLLAWNYRLR
jgi:hypothetical protein